MMAFERVNTKRLEIRIISSLFALKDCGFCTAQNDSFHYFEYNKAII